MQKNIQNLKQYILRLDGTNRLLITSIILMTIFYFIIPYLASSEIMTDIAGIDDVSSYIDAVFGTSVAFAGAYAAIRIADMANHGFKKQQEREESLFTIQRIGDGYQPIIDLASSLSKLYIQYARYYELRGYWQHKHIQKFKDVEEKYLEIMLENDGKKSMMITELNKYYLDPASEYNQIADAMPGSEGLNVRSYRSARRSSLLKITSETEIDKYVDLSDVESAVENFRKLDGEDLRTQFLLEAKANLIEAHKNFLSTFDDVLSDPLSIASWEESKKQLEKESNEVLMRAKLAYYAKSKKQLEKERNEVDFQYPDLKLSIANFLKLNIVDLQQEISNCTRKEIGIRVLTPLDFFGAWKGCYQNPYITDKKVHDDAIYNNFINDLFVDAGYISMMIVLLYRTIPDNAMVITTAKKLYSFTEIQIDDVKIDPRNMVISALSETLSQRYKLSFK